MPTILFTITVIFHLLLPLGIASLLAWRPARSRLSRGLGLLALLGCTGFVLYAGGGWGVLGQGLRLLVAVGVLVLSAVAAYRARKAPTRPKGVWAWLATGLALIIAVVAALPYPALAQARALTGREVNLHLPLERGRYFVQHGGANAAVNYHAVVDAQRYALDILAVDSWGLRASGAFPAELSAYRIFARRVLAPCAGTVLAERGDLSDLPPLESDPSAPAGNHVLLYCPEHAVTILLAHLSRDSVSVSPGQQVTAGQVVGRVGNSGNTSEPHLHIHAVQGRLPEIDQVVGSAEPVGMRFDGRSFVRNDIFDSTIVVQ